MIGVTGGGFRTAIDFAGTEVDLEETSLVAGLGYHFSPRWGLNGAVGAVLGGKATVAGAGRDVGPGVLASVSASYLAVYEKRRRPFLLASLSLGASTATAVSDDSRRHRLTAGDVRLAVMIGKTFGRVVPFAAARAFGGPVSWTIGGASVTGGDVHHYTIGGGFTVRLSARFDLLAELMPLGEQSATAGATYRY